ncbi:hypothetical protein KAW50_03475 [candidate division WOR-3 bacterium]|nr:hypothetical protein [candidate division WOR-3 bacterium]
MSGIPQKTYKVVLEGMTAIRHHRRPMPGDLKMPSIGSRIPTPQEAKILFNNHRYWDKGKGKGYYQPASQIRKMLTLAAARKKVPGQGNTRFAKYVGSGGILIEPDKIYHKNQKDVRSIGHWTVNINRGARNQVWCVKPEIHSWKLEFKIINNLPEIITDADVKEFLDWGGLFLGLGTDRPERGKLFGRFEVKEFKLLKK